MTKQITLPEQLLQTLLGGEKQARAAIAQARKQVEAEIAQLGKQLSQAQATLHSLTSSSLAFMREAVGRVTPAGAASTTRPVAKHSRKSAPKTTVKKTTIKKKDSKHAGPSRSMTPEQRAERREQVLAVLRKLPKGNLASITSEQAAAAVKSSGINLKVSPAALRTTVGNILYHSKKEFKQVKPGVYRHAGA